jgi:predicted nucleic acid-binding protein
MKVAQRGYDRWCHSRPWVVVDNAPGLLVAAVGLQERTRISFWDALVVQAALDAGCDRLYSEDLNAGQRFGSLLVVNPFAQPVR